MKYTLTRLNNLTIDLNDKLVEEYQKYDDITEFSFCIAIKNKYGENYNSTPIEEINQLCNEVLLTELKAITLLSKTIQTISESVEKNNKTADEVIYLTFKEIKALYPDDYVGLVNVKRDKKNNIIAAVVKYSTKDTPYETMVDMALDGEIDLVFPNADNVEFGGGI